LNSDGTIVAIGATMNDGFNGDSAYSGHVRIYENTTGSWVQLGNDIDGEAPNHTSGFSVCLDSSGTTVAIGAHSSSSLSITGYVKVYEFVSGEWQQKGTTITGDSIAEDFGSAVSISSEGDVVAIGGPKNNYVGDNAGYVKVFYFDSGDWQQKGNNIYAEDSYDWFGYSVSLNSNGSVLAIGAPGNNSASGHVRVFEYNISNWVQVGNDIDGEYPDDESGTSVSVNALGDIVAIGAPFNSDAGTEAGQVRVYENSGGNWILKGNDIDGESTSSLSGTSVSISDSGNIVAIGGPYNEGSGDYPGHTRVYSYNSTTWIQQGADIDGEISLSEAGNAVSLNYDGSVVAIGAPFNNGNGTDAGHVRIYGFTTGINEIDEELISVYPNPASDMISVDVVDYEIIRVLNSCGHTIYESSKDCDIDLKEYPSGIYFINVVTNEQIITKKIVKQ
jgi:hypothetical protein